MSALPRCLVIACGALAREIVAVRSLNGWSHMAVQCLPADLHNHPERITAAVREKIRANRGQFESLYVAYADCGTGGQLDAMLREEQVERLPGAHCYAFFAGQAAFERMAEEALGTFYLTDFLLTHFERLIVRGLGLDRNPELRALYFGNYQRLMYLAQIDAPQRLDEGRRAAQRLGLEFAYRWTGYGELAQGLARAAASAPLRTVIPLNPVM